MAVLRQDTFRRVYTGAFLSNIGTWMQNVALAWLEPRPTALFFAHAPNVIAFGIVWAGRRPSGKRYVVR